MRIHVLRLRFILFAWAACIYAQSARPEAGPFDAARMDMQTPPAQGIAIRAGHLFDSRSGAMLNNQVETAERPSNFPAWRQTSRNTSLIKSSAVASLRTSRSTNL